MKNRDRPSFDGSVDEVDDRDHAHSDVSVRSANAPLPPVVGSLDGPPVVSPSNHNSVPGALPVRPSRGAATSSVSIVSNEETKQDEELSEPTGAAGGAPEWVLPVATELVEDHIVEAHQVQAPSVSMIVVGLVLFAFGLLGAVIVIAIVLSRQPAAPSSSSLSPPPTPAPNTESPVVIPTPAPNTESPVVPPTPTPNTGPPVVLPTPAPNTESPVVPPTPAPNKGTPSPIPLPSVLTPAQIGCEFLSFSNETECRLTSEFGGKTTGSSIPSEIGLMTHLTLLELEGKMLSSRIPSEIGRLTHLTKLNLFNNLLSGAIPSEIGLLTKLTELYLHNNGLSSIFPTEIGLLTRLSYLWLFNNSLSGTIPSSLCSLPSPPDINIDIGEIACASGCCS